MSMSVVNTGGGLWDNVFGKLLGGIGSIAGGPIGGLASGALAQGMFGNQPQAQVMNSTPTLMSSRLQSSMAQPSAWGNDAWRRERGW